MCVCLCVCWEKTIKNRLIAQQNRDRQIKKENESKRKKKRQGFQTTHISTSDTRVSFNWCELLTHWPYQHDLRFKCFLSWECVRVCATQTPTRNTKFYIDIQTNKNLPHWNHAENTYSLPGNVEQYFVKRANYPNHVVYRSLSWRIHTTNGF